MTKLLSDGRTPTAVALDDIARDIQRRHCYVALDFAEEMTKGDTSEVERDYELPDGRVITLGNESFRCPEALFQPSLKGGDAIGVQTKLYPRP